MQHIRNSKGLQKWFPIRSSILQSPLNFPYKPQPFECQFTITTITITITITIII